jgi:hypothetical protein
MSAGGSTNQAAKTTTLPGRAAPPSTDPSESVTTSYSPSNTAPNQASSPAPGQSDSKWCRLFVRQWDQPAWTAVYTDYKNIVAAWPTHIPALNKAGWAMLNDALSTHALDNLVTGFEEPLAAQYAKDYGTLQEDSSSFSAFGAYAKDPTYNESPPVMAEFTRQSQAWHSDYVKVASEVDTCRGR